MCRQAGLTYLLITFGHLNSYHNSKNCTSQFDSLVMCLLFCDNMENSVDPDQTAPLVFLR